MTCRRPKILVLELMCEVGRRVVISIVAALTLLVRRLGSSHVLLRLRVILVWLLIHRPLIVIHRRKVSPASAWGSREWAVTLLGVCIWSADPLVAEDGLREGRGRCGKDTSVVWLIVTIGIISSPEIQMQSLLGIHDLDLPCVEEVELS